MIESTDERAKEFTLYLWAKGSREHFESCCIRKINVAKMSHRADGGAGHWESQSQPSSAPVGWLVTADTGHVTDPVSLCQLLWRHGKVTAVLRAPSSVLGGAWFREVSALNATLLGLRNSEQPRRDTQFYFKNGLVNCPRRGQRGIAERVSSTWTRRARSSSAACRRGPRAVPSTWRTDGRCGPARRARRARGETSPKSRAHHGRLLLPPLSFVG